MNKYAQLLGKLGGKARAKSLTKDQKTEIARKAVQVRWNQYKMKKIKGDIMKKVIVFLLFSMASISFAGGFTRSIGDYDYKYNDDGSVEQGHWIGGVYYTNTIVDADKKTVNQSVSSSNLMQNYQAIQCVQVNQEIADLKTQIESLTQSMTLMTQWAADINKQVYH